MRKSCVYAEFFIILHSLIEKITKIVVYMRKTILFVLLTAFAIVANAIEVKRVEPLSWWTNMKMPLTLMVYGEDLADAQVSVARVEGKKTITDQTGLTVRGQHNAESRNYLFLDMDVRQEGTYKITVKKGKKTTSFNYVIAQRRNNKGRESFTSRDVVYLITPDRFRDGDASNNVMPGMLEPTDKTNIHGRQGGDIQGIINELDHIVETGATAIWPTPLTVDNDRTFSYHGYACSDYYHIDPRFGSNELYCQMVEQAHKKGLKFIMDIVTNHCGTTHWWSADLPYKDWWHQFDEYTATNNAFTTWYDPNASAYDCKVNAEGWFDHHMADMNLDNPDLLHYFQQWAIWWVEYANLDGLRVDTYPYNEKNPMSRWCQAVRADYPWINIVGECWTRPASAVAYWQADAKNFDGFNSNLPTVMDFPVEEAIRQALENDGAGWGNGMTRVYDALAMDGLYANTNNLLLFVGNHDMDRFADVVKDNDPRRVVIGHVLMATMRGIPQLYAGDEYGQRSADIKMGHSGLRQPLPTKAELTDDQMQVYKQISHLLQWRQKEPAIWKGRTMHFMSRDNTYAYFRYLEDEAVFVFINASEEDRVIPTQHYSEILSAYNTLGIDVMTDEEVDLKRDDIKMEPLSYLVVKLSK